MKITAYPVVCPTCDAKVGERCSTRAGNAAARPHKARLAVPIAVGQHTDECRAAAVTSAVENIADWDTRTRADYGTDPIHWADQWLDDGTCQCMCWTSRRTPMDYDRIRAGRSVLDAAPAQPTVYQSYSVRFVDADGNRLPGSPLCEYQAHDPRTAATLAAEGKMPGNPAITVTGTDDGHNGGTWTFTPSNGSPVRVQVTPAAEPTLIAHGPERAPEPAPTLVGYVTVDLTSPKWAAALAISAALDAADEPADDEPASEIRTCAACGEPIEFYEGIGWVEVEPDGHYDQCPEGYIEATDTPGEHTPAPTV